MAVNVPRENKHTQWEVRRMTEQDILRDVYALLTKTIIISLLLICEERLQEAFRTKLERGNNNSCITTARDVKSLCMVGSSTTHGRTSKNSHGSDTQLPYSVQGEWDRFTRGNNYWRWKLDPFLQAGKKLDPFLQAGKKISMHGFSYVVSHSNFSAAAYINSIAPNSSICWPPKWGGVLEVELPWKTTDQTGWRC